jgi:ribonucleoside-diphosphate reductase alpha chain
MTERKEPIRYRLDDERASITHKFVLHGDDGRDYKGYITVGFYEDGTPGEFFIRIAKIGSMVNGLLDTIATSVSIALQYGIPLSVFISKFSHVRFSPEGMTDNKDIPIAKSLVDYIFRWLGNRFPEMKESE